MRHWIGVHIELAAVSVTVWHGHTRAWHESHAIDETSDRIIDQTGDHDATLHRVTASLLRVAPRRRWWPRPSVIATVGPHAARIKRLRGLPQVSGARMLDAVVRENASRFFLWDVPFATTNVHALGDGEATGGAIRTSVIDSVNAACAEAGYILTAVRPQEDARLSVHPAHPAGAHERVPPWRAALAIGILLIATTAAILAPGVAATRTARRATRALAVLAPAQHRAAAAEQTLHATADALTQIAQFEQNRRAATQLLAALADALPPESAITAFRLDTAGADIVVVSTRAAAVLSALDHIPGVLSPQLVGPVSRETAGTREFERATARFRYDPTAAQATLRTTYAVERDDP